MKFVLALLVAIVAAEEEADAEDTYEKKGNGEKCSSTAEKSGCIDGHRCGKLTAGGEGVSEETCMPEAQCDEGALGIEYECGAKSLAASVVAAIAIASAL